VPKTEKTVIASNMGFRELYPVVCGFEDCCGGHSFGPAVRQYYLLHYIRDGMGVFVRGGKEYRLTRGQCFLIRPDEVTYYRADDENPWHYIWIAFAGERASELLEAAGLGNACTFENERVAGLFDELFLQISGGMLDGRQNELGMLSVLYALFASFPKDDPVPEPGELYVAKVKDYVTKMISYPVTVRQLADYCGLERHYLCRVFKSRTGLTLQEYTLDCKMRRARELLLSTPLGIGDIARSVGYSDVYNFSRIFKKRFGSSPKKLRDLRKPEHEK
jgi:AraC-like DNA-binding protein